jgi:hypothetical protein
MRGVSRRSPGRNHIQWSRFAHAMPDLPIELNKSILLKYNLYLKEATGDLMRGKRERENPIPRRSPMARGPNP